jgi:hypothetical protein
MSAGYEPDRDQPRDEEQALKEIRLLFARYRRIARHGMVTEQDEPAEPPSTDKPATPALAGR